MTRNSNATRWTEITCPAETSWTPDEHAAFMARDLSRIGPVALFLDGVATPRPMLCAWTLNWAGERELLSLVSGDKSSPSDCAALVEDLHDRGLSTPVIVVADGDAHMLHVAAREFPTAIQQRCLRAHERGEEELTRGLPTTTSQARRAMRAAHEAPSVSLADLLRRDVVRHHGRALPALTTWFDVTFEACTAYLTLPRPLQRIARTTHVEEMLAATERGSLHATCEALQAALAAWAPITFLEGAGGEVRGTKAVAESR